MKIAVITDIHYSLTDVPSLPSCRGKMGLHLINRAVNRINRFIKPDIVVVLGDVIDDGHSSNSTTLLMSLKGRLDKLECQYLAIPGNHDGDKYRFQTVFGDIPDFLDIAGVRLVPFLDADAPDLNATRSYDDLNRSESVGSGWTGPIVALQHVPLLPDNVDSSCPYNLTNATEAISRLRLGGISLTLAGHYHKGLDTIACDSMEFIVAPALCEWPFRFLEIDIPQSGRTKNKIHQLGVPPQLCLTESHVHTELAYCASNVTVDDAIEMCHEFGVHTAAFCEHSAQLYFDMDTFWTAAFMNEGLKTSIGKCDRSNAYFEKMNNAGMTKRQVGLEVDFDFQGQPVLRDCDRARVGFLIGAVHWTPHSAARKGYDQDIIAGQHLQVWPSLISSNIDILAHPFRIFNRYKQQPPPVLFKPLADMLAKHNVAAELNFHIQQPNPEFTGICLEMGVKLSFGTDSHCIDEVADFWPHIEFLASLGVTMTDLPDILWRPNPDIS